VKPRPTQVWYPAKVLPWSALSTTQCGRDVPSVGPDHCYGFMPMYESEEAARLVFPTDVILSFRLEPEVRVVPPKPKKKARRKP